MRCGGDEVFLDSSVGLLLRMFNVTRLVQNILKSKQLRETSERLQEHERNQRIRLQTDDTDEALWVAQTPYDEAIPQVRYLQHARQDAVCRSVQHKFYIARMKLRKLTAEVFEISSGSIWHEPCIINFPESEHSFL
jgi:hypothetical protein